MVSDYFLDMGVNQYEQFISRLIDVYGISLKTCLDAIDYDEYHGEIKDYPPILPEPASYIPDDLLDGLNIEILDINENLLVNTLPESLLDGKSEINFFQIRSETIEQLPQRLFRDIQNLEYFFISAPLHSFPNNLRNVLTYCETVTISNTLLTDLPDDLFADVEFVREGIELTNNRFTKIPEAIFDIDPNHTVFLNNNDISELNADDIPKQLSPYIDLQNNPIEQINLDITRLPLRIQVSYDPELSKTFDKIKSMTRLRMTHNQFRLNVVDTIGQMRY